jgi:hypothetical protein
MAKLTKYGDFVERVNELGFMTLSRNAMGLPSLAEETPRTLWHSGDHSTDPWCWKDQAAAEKQLAYGCIVGGHKGFVAARMYPVFYAAYHPAPSMRERWEAGLINQTLWQVWQQYEEHGSLNTSAIRRLLSVTRKSGASRVDAALRELQHCYYITVAGDERKIGADGQPFGWPVCVYQRVTDWAPAEWLAGVTGWRSEDAREAILDDAVAMSGHIHRDLLAKKLF